MENDKQVIKTSLSHRLDWAHTWKSIPRAHFENIRIETKTVLQLKKLKTVILKFCDEVRSTGPGWQLLSQLGSEQSDGWVPLQIMSFLPDARHDNVKVAWSCKRSWISKASITIKYEKYHFYMSLERALDFEWNLSGLQIFFLYLARGTRTKY